MAQPMWKPQQRKCKKWAGEINRGRERKKGKL